MRIGLFGNRQHPVADFRDGSWRIWVSYNSDLSAGTYYDLRHDGIVDMITLNEASDIAEIVRLKS